MDVNQTISLIECRAKRLHVVDVFGSAQTPELGIIHLSLNMVFALKFQTITQPFILRLFKGRRAALFNAIGNFEPLEPWLRAAVNSIKVNQFIPLDDSGKVQRALRNRLAAKLESAIRTPGVGLDCFSPDSAGRTFTLIDEGETYEEIMVAEDLIADDAFTLA